jgi:hypothetical protein
MIKGGCCSEKGYLALPRCGKAGKPAELWGV